MESTISPQLPLITNLSTGNKDYVFFVGAGISKDAGVKSGWDILIETLKPIYIEDNKVENQKDIEYKKIEEWYLKNEKLNKLGYSEILEIMYKGEIERREYLKKFFDDLIPGEAHKELARMVSMGLVRYIFTTNFDDLIEKALDEYNINYDVIFSDDILSQTKSWDRVSNCRVYKLHGDYKIGRIRNTISEIESLDPLIADDFSYIINRHGVIVMGYAGRDKGVMHHFLNRKPYHYPIYWQYVNFPVRNSEYIHFYELKDKYEKEYEREIDFIQNKSASKFLTQIIVGIEKLNLLLTIQKSPKESFDALIENFNDKKLRSASYEILNQQIQFYDECKLLEEKDEFITYKFDIFKNLIEKTDVFFQYLDSLLKYNCDQEFTFIVKKLLDHITNLDWDTGHNEFIKSSFPYYMILSIGSILIRYEKVILADIFWDLKIKHFQYDYSNLLTVVYYAGRDWEYIAKEIYNKKHLYAKYSIIRDHLLPQSIKQQEFDQFDSFIILTYVYNESPKDWLSGSQMYSNGNYIEVFVKYFEHRITSNESAENFVNNLNQIRAVSEWRDLYNVERLSDYIKRKYKLKDDPET